MECLKFPAIPSAEKINCICIRIEFISIAYDSHKPVETFSHICTSGDNEDLRHTGQITYAVRDTRIEDKEIHEGDIMGIGDKGILAVGKGKENVAVTTVDAMMTDDAEVISIYYGADASEEKAEALAATLEEKYPDCEVEVNNGGQPIYYYIISVE